MGEFYSILEQNNHRCVKELTNLGYELANQAKAFIDTITPDKDLSNGQKRVTRTVQDTREHQNLLMNYG